MKIKIRREKLIYSDIINNVIYRVYIINILDTPISFEIQINDQRVSCLFLEHIKYFLSTFKQKKFGKRYYAEKNMISCSYNNKYLYLKNFNRNCLENKVILIKISWNNIKHLIKFCDIVISCENDFLSFGKNDKLTIK